MKDIHGLLAIRIDGSWTEKGMRLVTELAAKCEKGIFYEHPASGSKCVHIHGLVYGWGKGEDTLRNLLKSINGGSSYECKDKIRPRHKDSPVVNEDYIAYMSKGKYDPMYNSGFSEELVSEQKAKGYDRVDVSGGKLVIRRGVNVDGESSNRKTRKELVQGIVEDLGDSIRRADERDICEVIRKHLIRNNEVIGMYKVIDLYDSVLMYAHPDKWIDMVSAKIISRTRI